MPGLGRHTAGPALNGVRVDGKGRPRALQVLGVPAVDARGGHGGVENTEEAEKTQHSPQLPGAACTAGLRVLRHRRVATLQSDMQGQQASGCRTDTGGERWPWLCGRFDSIPCGLWSCVPPVPGHEAALRGGRGPGSDGPGRTWRGGRSVRGVGGASASPLRPFKHGVRPGDSYEEEVTCSHCILKGRDTEAGPPKRLLSTGQTGGLLVLRCEGTDRSDVTSFLIKRGRVLRGSAGLGDPRTRLWKRPT